MCLMHTWCKVLPELWATFALGCSLISAINLIPDRGQERQRPPEAGGGKGCYKQGVDAGKGNSRIREKWCYNTKSDEKLHPHLKAKLLLFLMRKWKSMLWIWCNEDIWPSFKGWMWDRGMKDGENDVNWKEREARKAERHHSVSIRQAWGTHIWNPRHT